MALIFDTVITGKLHTSGSTNNARFMVDAWGTKHQTDNGYILLGPANSSHAHIYTDRGSFYLNKAMYVTGGTLLNPSDIRSSIFYDVDNTGYYVNPAGTSNLSALNVGGSAVLTTSSSIDASDITSGTLSGDRLPWANNDGFTGTYPLVWKASNTPYTASWLNVNGSTDTLHTVNLSTSADVNISGDLSVTGGGITRIGNGGYDLFINGGVMLKDYVNAALTNGRFYFQNDAWYFRGGGEGEADTTTNTAMYIRHSNGFGEVWHSRNDGSGSGLDADTLDGFQLDSSSNTGARANVIPYIKSDSVMEIGKYIDFHDTGSTADYDIRLSSSSSRLNVDGGYFQVNGSNSVRASLFYDVDNTNYYLNAASGNTSHALKVNGQIYRDGFDTSSNGDNNKIIVGQDYSSWIWNTATNWGIFWAGNDNAAYTYFTGTNPNELNFVGSGSVRASIDLDNGQAYFATSVRSPIFYDSDNTSYYCDPTGTSRLNMIYADDVTTTQRQAAPRWDSAFYVLQAQHWYGDSSSQTMFIGESGNTVNLRGRLDASIMYDYNNTTYYVDPASTSTVNVVNFAGYSSANGGFQVKRNIGTTSPSWQDANHTFSLENSDAGYLSINFHRAGYTSNNIYYTGTEIITDDTFRSTVDMRAPIFYDSNNTAYYVDPASTSNMLNINMNNGTLSNVNHITINDPGVGEGIQWNGGNGWQIYESADSNNNGSGNLQFATGTTHRFRVDTNGNTFSLGSSRAPVFYDYNDTAYYIDGASTSSLNNLRVNTVNGQDTWEGTITINGDANTYYPVGWYGGEQNQIVEIEIYRNYSETAPSTWNTSTHKGGLVCKIRTNFGGWGGSNYDWKLEDFRETYSTMVAWAGHLANMRGFAVRLRGGGAIYHVRIKGRSVGPTITYGTWDPGNNSTGVGTSTTVDSSLLSRRNHVRGDYLYSYGEVVAHLGSTAQTKSGTLESSTDFRAPIFYDSNNTAYYVNPAGSSQVADIYYNAWLRNNRTTSSGLHWESGSPGYGWHLYPANQNDFRFRTGSSNGGIVGTIANETARGYIHWTTSNEIGFLNASRSWSLRVDNSGNTFATTSHRAPIFYDSNNTNYYINPADGSRLIDLNVTHFGIANTSSTSRDGISLYSGPQSGEPAYGILFTGTAGMGTHGAVTSDWATYFTMNNANSRGWIFRRAGSGNSASISAGGAATFDTSVTTGVIYDVNNTSYNLDPNGTSNLNVVNASSINFPTTGGGLGTVGNYFNALQIRTNAGAAVQIGGSGPGWVQNDFKIGNGDLEVVGAGSATVSFSAPIFYDSNDTTYYCNPNSDSLFKQLRCDTASAGWSAMLGAYDISRTHNDSARHGLVINAGYYPHIDVNATATSDVNPTHGAVISMTGKLGSGYRRWGMGIAQYNPNELSFGYYDNQTNPHYGVGINWASPAKMWIDTGGHLYSTGSMRSPIFYDSNDTGYYCDPASTSILKKVQQTGAAYTSCFDISLPTYASGIEITKTSSIGTSGISFKYNTSFVGSITINNSSTAYNTTSDYRLKENLTPITDGIERVKLLQPKKFNFIGESDIVDGFVAHEAAEVVPESVTGEKDELDHLGNPKYQGIDQAKLVPLLTAALKEAIAKIEDLENRLQILENQ